MKSVGLVFCYYRWNGWLKPEQPVHEKILEADKLNQTFLKDFASIPAEELHKAAPKWAVEMTGGDEGWLRQLLKEPALWLRARRGLGDAVAQQLGNCGRVSQPGFAEALRYEGLDDLFRHPVFHEGGFELQDISSQAVGSLCAPEPGETWWDACAGQGGKTLHLCDLMQGKGTVWATDRAEWRLRQLKLRAARAKVFNYREALWDGGAKLPNKNKFGGILVDAPCSGLGTWQRNPHAKWTVTPEDVKELAQTQLSMLSHVAKSLKPGGKLVYSVCTLTLMETVEIGEKFARKFPGFKPLSFVNPFVADATPAKNLFMWPQQTGGNGMFVCGWRH